MPRYPVEHKAETRRRSVDTAGRRLKSDGIDGSGVSTLMGDAGLTTGGLYGQFKSKSDLVATVVADQLAAQVALLEALPASSDAVVDYVRAYLEPEHRDDAAGRCPSAALLDEKGRCDADDWDPRVLDGLAARRHVISVDNRGVGGSDGKVPGRVQYMAADIVTFVNGLGHRQVDLLGFSLGGMVAQVIALERPRLIRRLVLTGTGPAGFPGVGQLNRRLLADTLRGVATLSDPKPLLFFTRTPSGKAAAVAYMERLAERTEDRVPATRAPGRRRAKTVLRHGAIAKPPTGMRHYR